MVRSSEGTTYISQRPDEHGGGGAESLIKDECMDNGWQTIRFIERDTQEE